MGLAPIPWTAIHAYAIDREIADRDRFETLIEEMDAAILTAYHTRMEAAKND